MALLMCAPLNPSTMVAMLCAALFCLLAVVAVLCAAVRSRSSAVAMLCAAICMLFNVSKSKRDIALFCVEVERNAEKEEKMERPIPKLREPG